MPELLLGGMDIKDLLFLLVLGWPYKQGKNICIIATLAIVNVQHQRKHTVLLFFNNSNIKSSDP